ncbi:PREDICTED: protein ECERIFERUM 26-like isoform X2 [Lupinus angustifolius]|uniref:protein ECERIFERUM 26-like isoform X2 n=1 Tax=Lupinus angustifolius TaxID=3871 RepID=UPI00092E7F12|nr:PREDICTED: protein ECERIFERUM 26-like isoform X2 [Lupinus angustifolius]
MVSPQEEESLVYDVKLSSVGPGRITGSDVFHNPSGLDLAMKLHYIKIIYFFESEVAKNLNIMKIKESSFYLFNHYFITCGRFRRSEYGRPLIKCNDCGARFIEAKCKVTLDEWLANKNWPSYKLLVSQQVIGPELSFSPLVLMQITHFKCGGASFGLSWAHILGGPLSASDFINTWGQTMVNLCLDKSINVPRALKLNQTISDKHPICVKKVDSVGDHWILPNNIKMDTFSFLVSNPQINYLQENIWGQNDNRTPPFESICAIIWQCLAQVKGGFKPNIVTVCKTDPHRMRNDIIGNNQMIKKVEADSKYSIVNTDLRILASLLANQGIDEVSEIEKAIEKEEGIADFFVYGANLTFVDLQEINVYDLQLMGHKPRFVYYTLQGVGDEGVVLVMPCNNGSTNNCNDGKFVTIILAEDQMVKFKIELKINGLLLESDLE